MKLILLGVVLVLALAHGLENKARYDNTRVYKVHLKTDDQVKIFQEIEKSDSYAFMGHARKQDQYLTIMVAAHKIAEITDYLKAYNVEHEILDYNFQAKIDEQAKHVKPKNVSVSEFDWDNYFYLETIHAWLDSLADKYKGLITILDAGESYEGVKLKGVKLSHKTNNTGIFLEGGIHAREWISPATATFLLNQLLTSTDEKVKEIAQNFDWYIFPVINPDGYKYTFESDRMWRKTRQPNGLCRGTDLNRNWDSHWNETGASPDPCAYDYAGKSVFSEKEAKHISEYLKKIVQSARIQTYISLHSYSQLLMFPHASTSDKAENYDDLLAIGQKAVAAIKQRYGTEYKTGSVYETIYPSSGSSHDWAYTALKIPISYTFELRGPSNSSDMFILPADQITPTGLETLDGFVALLNEAKARGYYDVEKITANLKGSKSSRINSFGLINIFVVLILCRIFT